MKRREFITLAGAAAVAWPFVARAQQRDRVRRIGVLMNFAADDAEGQLRLAAFLQGLQETGWAVGRNVQIDLRWGAANNELYRKYAAELVTLAPDVVLASATPSVQALQHANRTVPIVWH
jgi:putative tryptophan/tyrosine transport system substrate-binding protein